MSNIDKRALREAAANAKIAGEAPVMPFDQRITALNDFLKHCTPETVLALLDELEAKDQRIAELERERVAMEAVSLAIRDEMRIAPPAPVVPDELISAMEDVLRISERDHDAWLRAKAAIAKCRAAMLQGAENAESLHAVKAAPILNSSEKGIELLHADFQAKADGNSPVIPDGWVACSERMPERDYVLAADFSGKQYPANLPNIQIGIYADWFDDGCPCWDDGDGNDLHLKQVTHWAQIPVAPQQVVKL